jgi:malonate transporter
MAHASWQQFNQPAFVAFALACGGVFGLILILRVLSGRHLADENR